VPIFASLSIAGVMVDRHNRKLMMMISDLTAIGCDAGISSCIILDVADMASYIAGCAGQRIREHVSMTRVFGGDSTMCYQRKTTAAPTA